MKEFEHSQEFHTQPEDFCALPAEQAQVPAEMHHMPAEYSIPDENPKQKVKISEKKKSRTRQLIAMCLTGFVAIQVLFTYFVPPTTAPGHTGPNQGGSSNQGQGGFQIRAMDSYVDDTYLKEGLQIAGEYFMDLDYIRASLKMMDAVCEFTMDYDPASLNYVAYGFHNSSLEDYDGSAVNGCYFYFRNIGIEEENDSGEMEWRDGVNAYIVSFEERSNGTYYRVVEVIYELPDIVAYGMSYDWSANIYYHEGVLDDAGNSSDFLYIGYEGNNIGEYKNVDDMYQVAAYIWRKGPVGKNAYLNGTELASWLMYDDTARDFVMDQKMQDRMFHAHWLTEDGKLDLNHSAVMYVTSDKDEAVLNDFKNNDALDVLAGPNFIVLKSTVDRQNNLSISGKDLDEPLFRIDLWVAENIKRVIKEQSGQNQPGGNPDPDEEFSTDLRLEELDDNMDLDSMKEYLGQACEKFFFNDYVSAAMLCRNALREYASSYSADDLYNTAMVWQNGTFSVFNGQDLRDGSGVYVFFYQTDEKYVGKESDDIYSAPYLNMTLLVSDKSGNDDNVRMMNIKLEWFPMMTAIYSCQASYVEATFRSDYYASDVELMNFYLTQVYNWEDKTTSDGVSGSSYIRGDINQDNLCGDVDFVEYGCILNADGTKYELDPYSVPIKIKLDKDGKLDIDGMGLLHYKQADGQSFADLSDAFMNDYDCPGYVYSYEQYGVLMLVHPEDSKMDYWREFVETDPLFTTGRSIEFWRMLQQHMK